MHIKVVIWIRARNLEYFEIRYETEVYARRHCGKEYFRISSAQYIPVRVIKREGRTGEVGILFKLPPPSLPCGVRALIRPGGLNAESDRQRE